MLLLVIKNTVFKIKYSLDELNSRLDTAEKNTNKLKDLATELPK